MCLLFISRSKIVPIFIAVLMMLIGATYLSAYQKRPKDDLFFVAKYYYGKPVTLEGVIISEPVKKKFHRTEKTTFHLDVQRFKTKWGWKKKSGTILINSFRDADYSYGEIVRLEGKLHRPFKGKRSGGFSYRDYLSRRGIQLILSVKKTGDVSIVGRGQGNRFKAVALKIKKRLAGILQEHLSHNESGIMQAVLLGDRHQVPKHIRELFQISGVGHILAISGLHIGMVAFLIFLFVKMLPIPRRLQILVAIISLVFYAFMTGARPSVVRATIMAVVILMSFVIEREVDSYNTLSLAALIILLINPQNLFDVGFQLSFVSVLAIITFYPKFYNFLNKGLNDPRSKSTQQIIKFISVSLAAYLGVAGLIAYYFHIVTPVAVLANLIVVPLIAVVVAMGMGLLFCGLVWPPLAFAFALCIKALLNIMVAFILLCVKVPGAYFLLDGIPRWGVVLYYFLVLLGAQGIVVFSSFLDKKKIYDNIFFRRKKL